MPANYIVINSKFKPFSYAEMLQPVQMATAVHQQLENEYSELATKANIWDKMANEQTDPYAYKMYKTYSNDLEEQAGQLAREGLTPASMQNMLKMKQRYSSDIIPIEQAYKRRQELIDEQRKLWAQNNTLMFDKDASMLSLDDLIKNPQLTYQSYSGALLTNQVATAAQNLAKEVRDNPRKWKKILGNQYFETIMQRGYKPEEILQVLQNDPNAAPVLNDIVEEAVGSSNIANWGDADTLKRAYGYARQGLWSAVGETQYQTLSNKAYDYAMQASLAKTKSGGKDDDKKHLYYTTLPKTTVGGNTDTATLNRYLKLLDAIKKDPEFRDELKKHGRYAYYNPDTKDFTMFNSGELFVLENFYRSDRKKIENAIKSSAVRELTYTPNITSSKLIIEKLGVSARSLSEKSEGDYTGLYKLNGTKKGKKVDKDDLRKYFTSNANVEYDPDLGFIIRATDDEGKSRSALFDAELLDDADRSFARAHNSIQTALKEGENETATLLIESLMKALFMKYNTMEQRQSETTSKDY